MTSNQFRRAALSFPDTIESSHMGTVDFRVGGKIFATLGHPDASFGHGHALTEIAPPFPVDDGLVLNQLPKWTTDPALRQRILVDNAARPIQELLR